MRTCLNSEIYQRRLSLLVIASLIASASAGCATIQPSNPTEFAAQHDVVEHSLESSPVQSHTFPSSSANHRVAKPPLQYYASPQTQNGYRAIQAIPTQNRTPFVNPSLINPSLINPNSVRLPGAPQPSYQYPATNLPSSRTVVQTPQIGFQPQSFGVPDGAMDPNNGNKNNVVPNVFSPNGIPQNGMIPTSPGYGNVPVQLPQPQQQPSYFQTPQPLPNQPAGATQVPFNQLPTLPLDVYVPTGPTSQYRIGGTYGSENGLVGQLIIEERDFDIRALPGRSPYPFRGAGQTLRIEAVPGADLQRYLISLADPNFRNTDYSLSVSGYLFERQYFDWDEKRVGGRVGLGRVLTDYLSFDAGLRMESVTIDNPRLGTSPQLNQTLGNNNLFLGSVGLTYDTRFDRRTNQRSPYMTPEGSYLNLKFTQAFGDFDFSRGEIDFRRHNLIYERPDGSGRHTIGLRSKLGFSGSSTPVFENYFAGGLSSMRGFDFRGISPIENGVRVGGEFQWLNSLEYMFPLDANDNFSGVMFLDFGTVEESVELNSENFRVAPGLGLRVHLPFAGMGGAPLAFDFAFPVSTATGDDEKSFHFMIGYSR